MNEKKFYQSSGFIVSLASLGATLLAAFTSNINPNQAAVLTAIISGAYMVARGIGKIGPQHDSKSKAFYETSEFWTIVLGAASYSVASLQGVIPVELAAQIGSVLGALYTISRRMSKLGDPNEDLYGESKADLLKRIRETEGR